MAWRETYGGKWIEAGCAEFVYGTPSQTMGCATSGDMCLVSENDNARGRGAKIAYKNVMDNVIRYLFIVCLFF